MPKLTLKRDNFRLRGWGLVFVTGILLTILALLDGAGSGGGTATEPSADATATASASGCRLEVTAAQLKVRSGPSTSTQIVDTLTQGTVVDGTRTVTNGFRQLTDTRWAASQFLTPLPDTNCA